MEPSYLSWPRSARSRPLERVLRCRPVIAGDLRRGDTLGRYEIIERIAVGGMAEIFLGRVRGTAGFDKLVAVKRILPHVAADQAFVEMFLAEARLAATLRHPN